MTDIAIIIVNWNTRELLRNCLLSLEKETTKYSYECYVIDNNSPDASAEMVLSEFPDVFLIANKDNKGFAGANNQALRMANARYYLLLNPDTVVIDGAIDKMIERMDREGLNVATCNLLNPDMTHQPAVGTFFSLTGSFFNNRLVASLFSRFISGKPDSAEELISFRKIDWAHGAVLMVSKEVLDKVGVLDEQFYIYGEEIDYYFRVRKAGYTAYFIPDISIIHYGKASSNQKKAEMFIQNYKSFYLLLKKHYPPYVYFLYRGRVYLYFPVWMLIHLGGMLKKLKREESRNQLEVYAKTYNWHFSKASFIKAR